MPPENFSFDKPLEQTEWKQCFARFHVATKLFQGTDWGAVKHEHISNRPGAGLTDKSLSQQLQLKTDLTLHTVT